MTVAGDWRLPRVLVVDDGEPHAPISGLPVGVFLRDLPLPSLVGRATFIEGPWVVDLDTIRGLQADEAGARFVIERLGAAAVVSRRTSAVRAAARLGALGLLAVHAFDSTGLRRIAEGARTPEGVGSLLSPGLVLPHLRDDELALLPRPLVAHGLIVRPSDAIACLGRADAVILRRDAARFLGTAMGMRSPAPLTSVSVGE
jgi:glycerol-3-phosphate responsive antiterminator